MYTELNIWSWSHKREMHLAAMTKACTHKPNKYA